MAARYCGARARGSFARKGGVSTNDALFRTTLLFLLV